MGLSNYNLGPKVALTLSNLKKKEEPVEEGSLDSSHTTPSPKALVVNNSPQVSVKSRRAKYKHSMKHKNVKEITREKREENREEKREEKVEEDTAMPLRKRVKHPLHFLMK